jgi:hypothetical protein
LAYNRLNGYRLRGEDIAAVPVMGAIEAPEEIAAQLIASFGLEGGFDAGSDAGIDAGIGSASEWPLEFAMSVALKLGIKRLHPLLRWLAIGPMRPRATPAAAIVLKLALFCPNSFWRGMASPRQF